MGNVVEATVARPENDRVGAVKQGNFFSVELLEQRQMLAADFELSITDTLGTLND